MKPYPTRAQLKALKRAGWVRGANGLAWFDPVGRCWYAPRGAVAVLRTREAVG